MYLFLPMASPVHRWRYDMASLSGFLQILFSLLHQGGCCLPPWCLVATQAFDILESDMSSVFNADMSDSLSMETEVL